MKKSDKPIVLKYQFDRPIEQVWEALTEHTEMLHWFFENIPEFKPEIGFKTVFEVQSDTRKFVHRWEIIEVKPYTCIAYRWNYDDHEGDSIVWFRLSENEGLVLLQLEVEIIEDFSDDIPEFRRQSCIGGWNYFLGGRLKEYLNKTD